MTQMNMEDVNKLLARIPGPHGSCIDYTASNHYLTLR